MTVVFVRHASSTNRYLCASILGGATPGSMPPHSTSIHEEGAVFKQFYLVKDGVFQEKGDFSSFLSNTM